MKHSCLFVLLVYALILAFSWLITCGLFYLITWCFSWVFTWEVATGVWLILLILGGLFNSGSN